MLGRIVLLTLTAILGATVGLGAEPAAKVFRAGAATSNITPPLGGPIIGGFLPIPSKHVHDELHARCLVLDDGATRVAIVVCDLLGIHRAVSDAARAQVQEQTGIPPERVLICATHTHSATSALGEDRYRDEQQLDEYQTFVARRIADGVRRAANQLRPAELAFGRAEAPEHVFNRRWYLQPGKMPPNPFGGIDQVKMNPPVGSPDLLEPAGPTDPAIPFVAVREPAGRPIALLACYSLHYVGGVANGDISADYFGMFSRRLEELIGEPRQDPPFVAMLANGTSGDVNNINFRQSRGRQQPYEQMRAVADDVAAKVHAAWKEVAYQKQVTLDARYRELALATRRPTDEQLAWARATLARAPDPRGGADLPRIYAERALKLAEQPERLNLPLQVLRLGEVVVATMPCEVFCEIGLEFKRRSPRQPAFLVSLAHGYFGYLPTPRQHRLGGYETWLGTNRLEVEASEKLLAALLEMTGEFPAAATE